MIPPDIRDTIDFVIRYYEDVHELNDAESEAIGLTAVKQWLDTLPAAPAPDSREALAEYAHEAWSGWMEYMFSKGEYGWADGEWVMPKWAVERWQRQMSTPYAELPEEEKESDRAEADKMLAIVERTTLQAAPAPDSGEGHFSQSIPVMVSRDTLGAIEALLAKDSTPAIDAIVEIWLKRTWETVNADTTLTARPTEDK